MGLKWRHWQNMEDKSHIYWQLSIHNPKLMFLSLMDLTMRWESADKQRSLLKLSELSTFERRLKWLAWNFVLITKSSWFQQMQVIYPFSISKLGKILETIGIMESSLPPLLESARKSLLLLLSVDMSHLLGFLLSPIVSKKCWPLNMVILKRNNHLLA